MIIFEYKNGGTSNLKSIKKESEIGSEIGICIFLSPKFTLYKSTQVCN